MDVEVDVALGGGGRGGYIYGIRYVAYGVVHAVRIDVIFSNQLGNSVVYSTICITIILSTQGILQLRQRKACVYSELSCVQRS